MRRIGPKLCSKHPSAHQTCSYFSYFKMFQFGSIGTACDFPARFADSSPVKFLAGIFADTKDVSEPLEWSQEAGAVGNAWRRVIFRALAILRYPIPLGYNA